MSDAIDAGYWRDVIGAEFDTLPRLTLTLAQAQRLWGITESMAHRVLESYVETGYLIHTPDGHYRRTDYASAAARSSHA